MTQYVKIKQGTYRNVPVTDAIFPLIKTIQIGAKGGFVTVDGTNMFNKDKIRVLVDSNESFELVDEAGNALPVETPPEEKDDATRTAEIAERFDMLEEMTQAAINNNIRAMIVSGPPGIGKSYGVETQLEKGTFFQQIKDGRLRYEIVKGSASALGLYQMLYNYRSKGEVLVFDDCDSILFDDDCLNLLKGALDSGKRRRISWGYESRVLADAGIPNRFDFNGSVIFITNLKFDQVRSPKLKPHLEAFQSRCHYVDLAIDTARDKLLRIKQVADTGLLFNDFDFDDKDKAEIIVFMDENKDLLREISFRMSMKVAELKASFPTKWKEMARTTCMKTVV